MSPLIRPPPLVRLRLHLSSHCHLSRLLSGCLLHRLLSRRRLPSACASAYHRAQLAPLVRLVVASPLVTPPPPVRLRLRLSLHCRLSSRPSRASYPAGCCVPSRHAATSHPPAPPPLIALPPLIAPLLRLLSVWLLPHLTSRRCLPFACTSASHRTAASHCTPLAPLVQLVVASLLITLPPPVHLHLCFSSRPSRVSCPAGCCVISQHATTAFYCAAASHRAPFAPLVRLVVATMVKSVREREVYFR